MGWHDFMDKPPGHDYLGGSGADDRKSGYVSKTTLNRNIAHSLFVNSRPQIWPSRVEIEVLRDQKVSLPALKDWIAKHAPVLCQLRPVNPQNQENLLRFNSLSSFINDRNTVRASDS